jgi:hypothetical protein
MIGVDGGADGAGAVAGVRRGFFGGVLIRTTHNLARAAAVASSPRALPLVRSTRQ